MCVQTHVHKTIKCIKSKISIKVVIPQSKEILRCFYHSCKYYFCPITVYCAQLLSRVRLCNAMDCSPPGSSVHGDSPGKNTGVVSMPSSRGSSQFMDGTQVYYTALVSGVQYLYTCKMIIIVSPINSCHLTYKIFLAMNTFKIYSQQLSNMQCSINYSNHTAYYTSMTYL